jgi:hypothetical protein
MQDRVAAAPTGYVRRGGLRVEGAFICLLPYILASAFDASPDVSWWIAWIGSWLIIWLTFKGYVFEIPRDRPAADQVMRPWFLMHLVFAGYNFLTAVFYWLDLNGITFGLSEPFAGSLPPVDLAAKAQRLYVLGHAALVIGIGLVGQVPRRIRVRPASRSITKLLVAVAAGSYMISMVIGNVPGLAQFQVKLEGLFMVAIAVSFGTALHERSRWLPYIALLNAALFVVSLMSGWKGAPIVMVILLASAFYPRYPRRTLAASFVVLFFGVLVLPSVATAIRASAWKGEATKTEAMERSYQELATRSPETTQRDAWHFLVSRLSEVGLFVGYLEQVPAATPYYESSILMQALGSVVPRLIWPEKPDLEQVVRQRVVDLQIVSSSSDVSAKPQFMVDGYLSYGALGVFLAMLLYGVFAQLSFNACASWLGGYLLGGVAFNGIFTILWQGSAFEFVFNAVFWSWVLILILHVAGRMAGVLRR